MKPAMLIYVSIIEYLRERAKELGYALAVHGSLSRDIDLVAIPWTEDAAPADQLVEALREKAHHAWGSHAFIGHADPTHKPHGRLSYVILFIESGHTYIDLSVMPRFALENEKQETP